ncbi:MAG: ABC transporter permease [Firmicutes bacterium]|nr:ABC transporter permease [Bacillota bacterium]
MNKLLSAGFSRLWKNKFFRLGMLLVPGFIAFILCEYHWEMTILRKTFPDYVYMMDFFLYNACMYSGLFASVFGALFLGAEYSDGTVRNKLAVGHSRTAVYLSSLTVCLAASLLVYAAAVLITLALGIPLFGLPETPPLVILQRYCLALFPIVALCALFTLPAMLIANRPVSVVICTAGVIALLFISMSVEDRLKAPETISIKHHLTTADGETVVTEELQPNPLYLTGTGRKALELFRDLLPTGMGLRLIKRLPPENPLQSCLGAVFVTAASTGGGILAFRKRNLK